MVPRLPCLGPTWCKVAAALGPHDGGFGEPVTSALRPIPAVAKSAFRQTPPHRMHHNRPHYVMRGARYRPGSDKDFERLYRNSYGRIMATVQAMLQDLPAAEDCAQETFVNAYRAWNRWKPEAPAEAWLHRIAINTAVTFRRRERLRRPDELIRRIGYTTPSLDPGTDDSKALLDALRRLSPELAALIVLRHVHGYTNREIAAALEAPASTIGYRLTVAKSQLAAELAAAGIEPRSPRPVAAPQLGVLINDMAPSGITPT